ncbi:hypothetical protein OS493_037335 [Desmophyllum pertusum]|uniref:Uncharacterized protein n=1 Tax=Desmophyllum pertusum TaxID=174260 RepID=A0A9W9YUG0_9CNID|nr:hypothetical protein OS493_037335 [Desmophyllum pertusum]
MNEINERIEEDLEATIHVWREIRTVQGQSFQIPRTEGWCDMCALITLEFAKMKQHNNSKKRSSESRDINDEPGCKNIKLKPNHVVNQNTALLLITECLQQGQNNSQYSKGGIVRGTQQCKHSTLLLATHKQKCSKVPLRVRQNMAFIIDVGKLKHWQDVKSDMNGVYSRTLRIATWIVEIDENKDVEVVAKKKVRVGT